MENKIYKVIYSKEIFLKIKTYSETRQQLIKEKLREIEIYLSHYPQIYKMYDTKNQFRKFTIKFGHNDGYVFLYTFDKRSERVFVAEFYHFKESY